MPNYFEDRENQGMLWSPDDLHSIVADRCLTYFVEEFIKSVRLWDGGPIPERLDELSYACLLLCYENDKYLFFDAIREIEACRTLLREHSIIIELDLLPWDMCLALLDKQTRAMNYFTYHLLPYFTAGGSTARMYSFGLGWLVRQQLDVEKSTQALLKNVADTLGYYFESLGLCAALYTNNEEFWNVADAYQPEERYSEQYYNRINHFKEIGFECCQYFLLKLELDTRKIISDFSLRIKI
jgi:hypothetical protein